MKKVLLNDWFLRGYNNFVPLIEKNREINAQTKGVTFDMKVSTPHSIYHDLYKNGYIDDPYFDMNSIKCEWVSNRWWVYVSEFFIDDFTDFSELVFDCVDGNARVFINDSEIGILNNSFIQYVFDVKKYLIKGKNSIKVIIEHAPFEFGQIGFSDKLSTQKPKFNYKWDFSTRLISLGINKSVYLRCFNKCRIDDVYFFSNSSSGDAELFFSFLGSTQNLKIKVFFDDKLLDCKSFSHYKFKIENPQFWYPNGSGTQKLYNLKVELFDGNTLIDSIQKKVGLKSIRFEKNEQSSDSSLPYTININNKKIYAKGVNITPLDITCCTENSRYDKLISLLKNSNVNFIRVWGGGVVESDYFYDLCDENGILVLQELPQSSTGIVNTLCKDEKYLSLLKSTAIYNLKRLRSHVSLIAWNMGNEFMDENGKPISFNDETVLSFKDLVDGLMPNAFFYPSSASGESENPNSTVKGVNHDVHGPWKYYPEHYAFYNNIDSLWHGEFGVDGMACVDTLKKFLSKDNLSVSNVKENLVWRHHGEWWDTTERDESIFGKPTSLSEMSERSQFIQAEGLRYALEANRRRAFNNSGSVVWQANECFPNVFSTSLIDFYMRPKLALSALEKAYSPLNVSLKYDKFILRKGETFLVDAFAIYDNEPLNTEVVIEVLSGKTTKKYLFNTTLGNGKAVFLNKLHINVSNDLHVKLYAKNTLIEFKNQIDFIVK